MRRIRAGLALAMTGWLAMCSTMHATVAQPTWPPDAGRQLGAEATAACANDDAAWHASAGRAGPVPRHGRTVAAD